MAELNSNIKGSITELQCILAFMSLGYQVSLPYGGQARYDFLVDINNRFIRVQVKTCRYDSGCIIFECRNSHYIQGSHTHTKYNADEIDYFATYWNNNCYLVPINECGNSKRLRLESPKINYPNMHFAKEYELQEVLNKI